MKKLIVVLSLLIVGWLVVGCKTNVEPEPENPKTEVTKKYTETKTREPTIKQINSGKKIAFALDVSFL